MHFQRVSKSIQNQAQNESNFVTLSQISEEVIQTGFRLNQALKKYYEGVSEANSLFAWKGCKYDTIRKQKLYTQLKQ
jgi:hypothetical protein